MITRLKQCRHRAGGIAEDGHAAAAHFSWRREGFSTKSHDPREAGVEIGHVDIDEPDWRDGGVVPRA